MSQINVVLSLKEFYFYIKDILTKYEALMYIEEKTETSRLKILVNDNNINYLDTNYNENNLHFFITTSELSINKKIYSFYSDEIYNDSIEGTGGRENKIKIERIRLRLISKKPNKKIKNIFNTINNKLMKDESFGKGVKGNSSIYKKCFYLKVYVNNKLMQIDINNDTYPPILPLEN